RTFPLFLVTQTWILAGSLSPWCASVTPPVPTTNATTATTAAPNAPPDRCFIILSSSTAAALARFRPRRSAKHFTPIDPPRILQPPVPGGGACRFATDSVWLWTLAPEFLETRVAAAVEAVEFVADGVLLVVALVVLLRGGELSRRHDRGDDRPRV